MARKTGKAAVAPVDVRFASVAEAFAKDRSVSREGTKGFGAGALKINGKIFAMVSSRGAFVVKLPKVRVDEMVKAGQGEPFDPGHGRRMKEWLVVEDKGADWIKLAREACEFVRHATPKR